MPVISRITTAQAEADKKRRSASELALTRIRRIEQIAEPAHGLDDVDPKLAADAPDEHFDGVGISVEILVVKMLDQFGTRDDTAGMVHQICEQAILVAGELDRVAVDRDAAGARVEANRTAHEFALGMAH